MMKTGQQNIDQIGQFLVGVEFKGTMCGHLRSAELKCEPVGYCQVITKVITFHKSAIQNCNDNLT